MTRSRFLTAAALLIFLAATASAFAVAGLSLGTQLFIDPWLAPRSAQVWTQRAGLIVPALLIACLALRILHALYAERRTSSPGTAR